MAVLLPLEPSNGLYQVTTSLYGTTVILDVRWNSRDNAYYMDISSSLGTPIATGLKIVLGTYIGRQVNHPIFTNGVLLAVDNSGQGQDAGFDDLGGRISVWYYSASELLAAQLNGVGV